MDESFGTRLEKIRKTKFSSKKEAAEAFKLTAAAYGMYERGLREPPYSFLIAFCKMFDVSADYLLGLTDSPHPKNIDLFNTPGYSRDSIAALTPEHRQAVLDMIRGFTLIESAEKCENYEQEA